MSGGYYGNYSFMAGFQINLMDVYADEETNKDFPELCALLEELDNVLCPILRDLDYHYASDSPIGNPAAFQANAIKKLHELFPADEVDVYAAIREIESRAKKFDDFNAFKARVKRRYGSIGKMLASDQLRAESKLKTLEEIYHEGKYGALSDNWSGVDYGVQVLENWQLDEIQKKIDELKQILGG